MSSVLPGSLKPLVVTGLLEILVMTILASFFLQAPFRSRWFRDWRLSPYSGAPPDHRDSWDYRSGALPEDCYGHCSGTPLLLTPLCPNMDHCCDGGGSTNPHADFTLCYGSAPPVDLGHVAVSPLRKLTAWAYSACYIRIDPSCVPMNDKWGHGSACCNPTWSAQS